jgi:hypothetical protein
MDHKEFVEWVAFTACEPIGHTRDDFQTALLMALLAEIHRNPKNRPQPFSVSEFLPDWWRERQAPSGGDLHSKFMRIATAINEHNTRVVDGEPSRDSSH